MFTPFAFIQNQSPLPLDGLVGWWDSYLSVVEEDAGLPVKWYSVNDYQILEGTANSYPYRVEASDSSYFTTELDEYLTTTFSLPSSTSPFTIMMWAYTDQLASAEGFFQFGDGNTNTNIQIFTSNNRWQWQINTGNTQRGGGDSGNTISANTWYQVTMTFDGTTVNGYINDVLEETGALGGGFTYNVPGNSNLNLFYIDRASFPDYDGNNSRIANLAIWDNALDLTTISSIFDFYKSRFGY